VQLATTPAEVRPNPLPQLDPLERLIGTPLIVRELRQTGSATWRHGGHGDRPIGTSSYSGTFVDRLGVSAQDIDSATRLPRGTSFDDAVVAATRLLRQPGQRAPIAILDAGDGAFVLSDLSTIERTGHGTWTPALPQPPRAPGSFFERVPDRRTYDSIHRTFGPDTTTSIVPGDAAVKAMVSSDGWFDLRAGALP
jgi:hypothetical protein